MGQRFLQVFAFPLQFEFLFDFPGQRSLEEASKGLNPLEKLLMGLELTSSQGIGKALESIKRAESGDKSQEPAV